MESIFKKVGPFMNIEDEKIKEDEDINYIWERMELRDGCYEYKINREIPQLTILKSDLNEEQNKMLDLLIDNIEITFPTYSIYLDNSQGKITNSNYKRYRHTIYRIKSAS